MSSFTVTEAVSAPLARARRAAIASLSPSPFVVVSRPPRPYSLSLLQFPASAAASSHRLPLPLSSCLPAALLTHHRLCRLLAAVLTASLRSDCSASLFCADSDSALRLLCCVSAPVTVCHLPAPLSARFLLLQLLLLLGLVTWGEVPHPWGGLPRPQLSPLPSQPCSL